MVTLSTAHPAKFPAAVARAETGQTPYCSTILQIFSIARSGLILWTTISPRCMPSWRRSVDLSPPTIRRRQADISSALQNAALPEVLKRVYASRVSQTPVSWRWLDQLLPPASLKGVTDAAELLADAIEGEARVLIVGDFDADGATSCAMAFRCCNRWGFARWPIWSQRFEFGYG